MTEWVKIKGKCPYCNKETVERNNSVVLTSYPAQNEYRCTTCNKVWSACNDADAVKETSSIVNAERIGDIPDNNFTGWGRQGWVCPKCGRVMSPDTFFCLFCSNEVKTTVTTNTGGTGGYSPNYTTTVSKLTDTN